MPLQESLESLGHQVQWRADSALGPDSSELSAELVILDADEESVLDGCRAWRDHDPPPAVLLIGDSDLVRQRSLQAQASFVARNANKDELQEEIGCAMKLRFAGRMSGPYARALLGLGPAQEPLQDISRIVAGSRSVDIELVRECLRWKANEYILGTQAIAKLREMRALKIPEVEITKRLDGSLTVQSLVKAAGERGMLCGRLLWGLISSGAAILSKEPPLATLQSRHTASIRRHLRDRHAHLQKATHYDVLEVTVDASAEQVDLAARTLALRFDPKRINHLDLGNLRPLVDNHWKQILLARQVLMDFVDRANYNDTIGAHRQKFTESWAFLDNAKMASDFFRRGQKALLAGEEFKAVSDLAAACRNHPNHPVYEASLCWARFRAEVARGGDRAELAKKERATAEEFIFGRRPWAQAQVALALLCAADSDSDAARFHLRDALAIDPNLPAAQQLLKRLG